MTRPVRKTTRNTRNIILSVLLSLAYLPTTALGEWQLVGCTLVWHGTEGRTERRCYRKSNLRDATVLSECPGAERNGALCYPRCRDGYSGAGPVCWQQCAQGYSDDGATGRPHSQMPRYEHSTTRRFPTTLWRANGGTGISTTGFATITGNIVYGNASHGLSEDGWSVVTGNTATYNGGYGLSLGSPTTGYANNAVSTNSGGTVSGGTDMGHNVCNSTTTCP